jgi:hypothetical protein
MLKSKNDMVICGFNNIILGSWEEDGSDNSKFWLLPMKEAYIMYLKYTATCAEINNGIANVGEVPQLKTCTTDSSNQKFAFIPL